MRQIYFYVKSGHKFGLDRIRRSVALAKEFGEDVLFLTSDYRAGMIAKELGIKRTVNVDIVRNITNIAEDGSIMIFDSDEASELMLEDMRNYFSHFIRFVDSPTEKISEKEVVISPFHQGTNVINDIIVDKRYFGQFEKSIERTYFWGDDDYNKKLKENLNTLSTLDSALLEGYYFFLGYDKEINNAFSELYESEEYEDILTKSKIFFTSSIQSALEASVANSVPIFIKRDDVNYDNVVLLEQLQIPIYEMREALLKAIKPTKATPSALLSAQNVTNVANFIKDKINL